MNANGGSSFTQELVNCLPGDKKIQMFTLIGRYRNGQIRLGEFLNQAKNLLGPRLYTQWVSRFPSAPSNAKQDTEKYTRVTPSPSPSLNAQSSGQSRNSSPAPIGSSFMTPMFPVPAVSGNYAAFTLGNSSMPTFQAFQPDHGKDSDASQFEQDSDLGLIAGPVEGTSGADVTQMDTSSLQDVIQYSGVDLKEEAENILRGHESFMSGSMQPVGEDVRGSYEYYLNVNSLKERIQRHCKRNGLRAFHDDCFYVIAFAVRDKLCKLIEPLHHISKHRIEFQRLRFKIRVENDPLKQVLVLQRMLGDVQPFSAGSTEPGRKEGTLSLSTGLSMPSAGGQPMAGSSQPTDFANAPQQLGGQSTSSHHPLSSGLSQDSTDGGRASKRLKKPPPSKQPVGKEREDVAIKTKLANVTAMAAVGGPKKSWMASGTGAAGGADGLGGSGSSNGTFSSSSWRANAPIPFTATSSDKDIALLAANRTITVQDLLFLMENDPYLSRTQTFLSIIDGSK